MTDPEYKDPRNLQLKVRPFEKLVGDSGGLIPLRCCGRIEGSTLVLDVGASSYRLPTAAVDTDSQGQFAMLQQCEQPIAVGFVLKVEFSLDEFSPGEIG